MSELNLKPCPFCGKEAEFFVESKGIIAEKTQNGQSAYAALIAELKARKRIGLTWF